MADGRPLVLGLAVTTSQIEVLLAFAVLGFFLLVGGIWWLAVTRPMLLMRPALWLVTHSIYRLRVSGAEHVPSEGAALLVCNHVSYIDWLLLLAAQKRYVRFLIWAPFTKPAPGKGSRGELAGFKRFAAWLGNLPIRGLQWVLKRARVIPIDGSAGPRAIVQSLRVAGEALAAGEVVCIFAEGGLTRTGFMLPFHRGFEQIVKRTPVPIIPVCLDNVWGSIFSWRQGKLFWKWPEVIPYPAAVKFGPPMPPTSSAADVRLAIQKLSADCAIARVERMPVHRKFVRMAARHPFRACTIDTTNNGKVLSYGMVLAGAMCLARQLKPALEGQKTVAIWLPPSVGGALANLVLALVGKTSVNLNYTASTDVVRSALQQCGARKIITSRKFLEKMKLEAGPDCELLYLEDLRERIGQRERTLAFLTVVLTPGFILDRWVLGLRNHSLDDLATIIFSSGTTGEPKGVMLSHRNIAANAESMIQAIDLRTSDRALGVLPFFHSFGYTVTIWVPLQVGASMVYHADPRQAKEIGALCRTYRCTIFLTTPTFLRFCLRRCEPDDFATLRILICGAEKLPASLAQEFKEKFGVLPLEGYGCTELAPVAAANVPDRPIEDGSTQVGNKPGTIGQPLPGQAARIVDPETFQPLPQGQEGLLLFYGANVMVGYLNQPEKTKAALRDGWYVTGDMAKCDADGFLTITGRLARFAKVGGEMVPLERLEEEIHQALGTTERMCVVAAVPDDKRGERIVVLHLELNGTTISQLSKDLGQRGLPNLWLPGERDFYQVEELPILGSGKLNLQRVQEIALEKTAK